MRARSAFAKVPVAACRGDLQTAQPSFCDVPLLMSNFQWVTVVFGMLTGLTVTRLMTSLASIIRSRHVSPPYWIPMVWGVVIFLTAMDAWWNLQYMKSYADWSFPRFLLEMAQPLLLYLAAVMILPYAELKSGEDQRVIYDQHGHWALLVFVGYELESLVEAICVWNVRPNTEAFLVMGGYTTLALAGGLAKQQRAGGIAAIAALVTNVIFVFLDINEL